MWNFLYMNFSNRMRNFLLLSLGTYSLTSTNEAVYGIWNTIAGGSSMPATSGFGTGNYPLSEMPGYMLDFNLATKYLSFGSCLSGGTATLACGINTGVYFTPSRGATVLRSLRFCTANDVPERDPLTVTVEGSNQTMALTQGSSWILLYYGSTGLDTDPGRSSFGITQYVNNFVWYQSYRLLVVSKRGLETATHYAEVQFFGY